MKNILVVINTMGYGGAEIQTLELVNSLVEMNYSIDIAVLSQKIRIIEKAKPEIRFHLMNKRSYLDFGVINKLRSMVRNIEPDIILCVDLYPAFYIKLALGNLMKNYQAATVFHSTLPQNFKEKVQRCYLTPMANSMNQLIFVSNNQLHYWAAGWKTNREKSIVIHNGIDLERFTISSNNKEEILRIKEELGFNSEDVVIGNCTNFRREKRHSDLIKAYARLKNDGFPVKLLLIGDGYMRPALEEQIFRLNLKSDAIITGFKADIRPYLAIVDIFALTSDSVETLSIAAIESLAMKKAVVLSNIGGASEIVNDGINGFLYRAGDIEGLVEKLETILKENKWRSMGEAGYEHARKHFHKDKMVLSYHKLFQRMASGY